MAERRTRRRFTREYKAQAVQRLLESGRPLADIATELDVSPGQLSQWRNEQLAAGSAEALAQKKGEAARRREPDPAQGCGFFRQGDRVTKFAFVAAERANHAVSTLCRVVGARVSGVSAWLRAIPARQSRAEAEADLRQRLTCAGISTASLPPSAG